MVAAPPCGSLAPAAAGGAMKVPRPLLEVMCLSKHFLGLTAVDNLSFEVEAGSVVGLIGPNGSGKSTSIDCISGFLRADGGQWFLDGRELTGQPPHRIARVGLTRTFQTVRAYDELTLLENLCVAAQESDGVGWLHALGHGRRLSRADEAARARGRDLLATVGLADYADAPAGVLSYGQRKLLTIAASMMARPRLVVLDEPVAGVNPTMIRRIEEVIHKLNAEGVTLVIVEHNVDFIMALCRRVIVLESGRKIADGPPSLIRSDPRVLEAYLGRRRATPLEHGHD
jgi:branched-chain amino acid transport system ATP-binding protein